MQSIRKFGTVAVAATAALALVGGCSSGGGSGGAGGGSKAGGQVNLTWWHNGTSDPLLGVWKQAAADYHTANPNVTINVVPVQNEQFTTKMPLALQSSNPPDIYFNQGGGLLSTQSQSGRVADISNQTSSWIKDFGALSEGWQVEGKQYGVPTDAHVVGFWYRKDLFAKAGITATPTTIAELNTDIAKLKAAGTTPIALGGKDRWPDAFYYDYFAVRECSVDTLKSSVKASKFSDPCFTKAGQDVVDFIASKPFQTGFNGTPAQQGAGSSAGLVVNGKAAMELQGDWDPSVMAALTADKNFRSKLGWFPFPAMTGGQGDPSAALGGGDGFACTTKNADACANFLKYLGGSDIQKKLVTSGAVVIPVNPAAQSAIKDPTIKQVFNFNQKASYVQVYFDIALPTAPGQALDDAAADLFAGKGGADSVAKAVNSAS
ncbi:ABC transporter substrate-binding protein [Jatrophihabitans lederbergiae]|uniref:Extracellular solute-binding protein n=1 Tax=Jatrophihabitans lederbergiae TaxID=3075547 RepID=A0ABU2JEW9_9ACTN|nr:extracellular solute-binding protein [Jatrophihabitans sp. DSM 44399]MDT0263545.1 extracellular solute-binding protein [Jatrophihabitans sp. DSM 44399]